MTIISRKLALAGGVAAVALTLAATAAAQTRTFNVPAQEAGKAIPEFARQAGVQIMAPTTHLRGVRTPEITGALDTRQALRALLVGTGLEIADDTGSIITLRQVARPQPQAAAEITPAIPRAVDELVVTGTRLASTSVDGPAPVTVFSREKLDQTGASGVADVLRALPQQSFALSENYNFANAQSVQLRGLGLGTTLVLINGRRTVSAALQGSRSFFDLNAIPLPAVERLEVLSGAASAIYGADAVGGVVNIILKSRVDRPTLNLYYGGADGGAEEKRASFTFGPSGERFRSVIALDYFDRDRLGGNKRALTGNQDFRAFGGLDRRSRNSNPGNISSATSANLPGLNSTFAAVPVGSTGVGLTPQSFAATAGTLNLASVMGFTTIVPASRKYSASGALEYDLATGVTAFGEYMVVDRTDRILGGIPSATSVLVPAANPFNPFGVAVRADLLLTGMGPRLEVAKTGFQRAVAGLKGRKGAWRWEVAGQYTRDHSTDANSGALNTAALNTALASTDRATAFNPFQDGPGGSPSLLASLVNPTNTNNYTSRSKQIAGFAAGPLFDLPAGPVQLAVGAEARREGIVFNSFSSVIFLTVDRSISAAFAEAKAPLVSEAMGVPLVRNLTLTAAARYDRYSDFGGTFNPQASLEWQITGNLMARASVGRSFRAPSLFELYQPLSVRPGALSIIDPKRRNEQYGGVDFISGGNVNLEPEKANTYAVGLVWRPSALPGLRTSVDYWRVEQNLRVQRFTPNVVLNNPEQFPGRIVRATPTAQDVAAGLAGRVLSVDAISANFGGVETDGVDFDLSYDLATGLGRFAPSLTATYVSHFRDALTPGGVVIERAGVASSDGSRPRWKAAGTLAWRDGGARASITGRYTAAYTDVDINGVRTGRDVASRLLTDAQVGYTFSGGESGASRALDGLSLDLGAINLFDKPPPYASLLDGGAFGYDPSQADLRQRFIYVKLSKAF